jgi:hypothetical protein
MENFTDNGSPYQKAKTLQNIVERVYPKARNIDVYASPKTSIDPFVSVQTYQANTGIILVGKGMMNHHFTENVRHKLIGKRVGSFSEEKNGLYVISEVNNSEVVNSLCNFHFKIMEIKEVRHRKGKPTRSITVRVHQQKDQLEVPAEKYEYLVDIILQTYPEAHISSSFKAPYKIYFREYAAAVFAKAKEEIEEKIEFDFHGWTEIDGVLRYLSAGRAQCNSKCFIPQIASEDIPAIWQKGIQFLTVGKKVFDNAGNIDERMSLRAVLPFFLYCHAGFAARLFKDAGVDLQFLLVLVGQSGSLKTAICKSYAEPFNQQELLSFTSTDRAIELYRDLSLDMNLILDDIFSNRDKGIKQKFEKILRAFGDGIGRAKSGPTFNEIEQVPVCGGCIVTAEHDLESQQSSALRCVSVHVNRESFDGEVLAEFQKNQKEASFQKKSSWNQLYFASWIQYLEVNYVEIVGRIRDFIVPEFTMKFKRQDTNYKIFCALADLVLEWGRKIGMISNDLQQNMFSLWCQVIQDVMLINEEQAKVSEPWQQCLQALQQGIGTGAVLLARDKSEYEQGAARYNGFIRKTQNELQYVLAPEKTIVFVRRWMEDLGRTLVSDQKTLFKKFYENNVSIGYVNKDGRGGIRTRYLKRIKLNGQLTEMLIINVLAMSEMLKKL